MSWSRDEAVRFLREGPGRRWMPLMLWAVKGANGKRPRHKRAVLKLASLAYAAEFAVWRWAQ